MVVLDFVDRIAIIDFLDLHRSNAIEAWEARNPTNPFDDTYEERTARRAQDRIAYRAKLFRTSDRRLLRERDVAFAELEQARPFNQQAAFLPDYDHYWKIAFLTVDEAVALSLGRNPRVVDRAMVEPYLEEFSQFAEDYRDRQELVVRAVLFGELPEQFSPLTFLTWAHQNKVRVPQEFIDNAFDRGEPVKYWRDVYVEIASDLERAHAEIEALRAAYEAKQQEFDQLNQQTIEEWLVNQNRIDSLNEEVSALKATELDKPLAGKERSGFLKVIVGMAMDAYGYDPRTPRSSTPREISESIERFGEPVTDETIRKILNEGKELFDIALIDAAYKPSKQRPKSAKR
jgi:hypothetical protein